MKRLAILLLAVAGCGRESPAVLSLAERAGSRFVEVSFTTSLPFDGRVDLGGTVLRPARAELSTEHRLLIPRPREGRATYRVMLPGEPERPLEAGKKPSIAVEQLGLELAATANLEATWSVTWSRGEALERAEGPGEPSTRARLKLGPLEASDELTSVRVEARFLDGSASFELGTVLGNGKLAAAVTQCVDALDMPRLLRLLGASSTAQSAFASACASEAARTGLDGLLEPALLRASAILTDESLDGPTTRLPFSYALIRLGNLEHLASLRGWPLPGRLARAAAFWPATYPKAPAPNSHSIYDAKLLKALGPWPSEAAGCGPQAVTVERVKDRAWLQKLKDAMVDETPAVLVVLPRGLPLLAHTFEARPEWLSSPGGFVRVQVDAGNLPPGLTLYLNFNDRAMVALRNRPETYPGPLFEKYKGGPVKPADLVSSWLECRIPALLLQAGKNRVIATAECAGALEQMLAWLLIKDLRIGVEK